MKQGSKEKTRSEWRELGFFYDRDDAVKEWRLIGSRAGLLRFADLLRVYVADPRNRTTSEHEHYGPYSFLEVMTWPEPGIDNHAIRGPLNELDRLASIVGQKLAELQPGETASIREEFASAAEYALVLEVRDDTFDPASCDPDFVENAG